jgi:LacI family transcriptional regulator
VSTRKSAAPTIVDVAAKAGVSRATASRALSGYGRVNSATVELVKKAAEDIGYRPNELARAMRAGRTKTIGLVIIADFTNAFFDRATKSIVDAASASGYQVLITNTDEDIAAERAAIETLLEKQVDGLIVVPSSTAINDHLDTLNREGTPLVLIDRSLDGDALTSVTTNDFTGTSAAVHHAFALGHKRMGFLIATAAVERFQENRPTRLISSIENRVEGFLQGARECGIKPRSQSWLYCQDDPRVSESAVASLLDQPKPPTVIFTSNNDMCLAVLKVAGNRQLVIGRDISLVTVDDSQWAAAIVPGITVVARPVEQLGQIAVQKLIEEIQQPGQPAEKIVLPTELVARQSIANLILRPELDSEFRE